MEEIIQQMQLYLGAVRENILLEGIHSSGRTVGNYKGKNLYIDLGIPDESVDIRLDRKKRGFYCGFVEKIHNSSPHRVNPFCKHFGMCGGCNWQHISYEKQLQFKKQILIQALVKYKIPFDEIKNVIPSPSLTYFRNKSEYSFEADGIIASSTNEFENSSNVLGFHPINRNDLTLEIDECFIQSAPARDIYKTVKQIALKQKLSFYNFTQRTGFLKNLIIRTTTSGQAMAIIGFIFNDPVLINNFLSELKSHLPQNTILFYTIVTSLEKGYFDGDIILYSGSNSYLTEEIDSLKFRYGPKSFYQPNPLQAANIYRKINELLALTGDEFIIDLYTGVGTIACFLANKCSKIIGIEGSSEAINYAQTNAVINNLNNTTFVVGDILETFKPNYINAIGKPDVIILDPPRSGTLIEIKKAILYANPQKILYVSCNPVSLAFDLTMLTQGYKIREIQPYDMFPHTHHLETVVLLEKE